MLPSLPKIVTLIQVIIDVYIVGANEYNETNIFFLFLITRI